jgi:hypothetical protein
MFLIKPFVPKDKVDTKWFFTELPQWCKECTLYVRGDLLVLLPLLAIILSTYFISLKFMVVMIGAYIAVRYLGEMVYWLLQQFGERKYRPGDFGFKHLDNHAIYIIYQTIATAWVMVGIGVALYALLYL